MHRDHKEEKRNSVQINQRLTMKGLSTFLEQVRSSLSGARSFPCEVPSLLFVISHFSMINYPQINEEIKTN